MPVTHMNFLEHFNALMIPEWKKQYVSYEDLNDMLSKEDKQDILHDNYSYQNQSNLVCKEFFATCDKELMKVNLFCSEKLSEACEKMASFGIIAHDGSVPGLVGGYVIVHSEAQRHMNRKKTELRKLKMAVGELYLSLAFLQSYQELNYKCFCKITKKYDAMFASQHGSQWRDERLDTSFLYTVKSHCEQMMFRLETFMLQLEGGNQQKAMRRLEVPQRGIEQTVGQWITFRIGVSCGLTVALLAFIAIKVLNEPDLDHLKPLIQLYRGSFLLIEFLLLMGLNIYCWRKSGINHVLIFELGPRHHLSHHHIFEVAGHLAVCWCASVLACLHPFLLSIPQQLHPLFFHVLLLLLLLNPTAACHAQSRRWLLAVMCKVLTAPFQPTGFAECWLADQLNSLSPLILSLWDLLGFYISKINWVDLQPGGSLYRESMDWERHSKVATCLLQCFPPWLRFAQCVRHFWSSGHSIHLLNAGKYSTVFLMVTFAGLYNTARESAGLATEVSVYLYLWAMATCISVVVTVSWDLRMDWGLLRGNGLLKEQLVYSREVYYYAAMLADVLLRLSWAINILLAQMKDSDAASVSSLLAPLEVLRRSIWNLFRLENEHLRNCEQCRAVRDFDFLVMQENSEQ
ncbi:xenotropic and polytropic retrovirus receptor 1 homolog [Electrophorus electricus]|uniref:xenotropic and polytropic retrovirus receptor 1 homolog n=1 Tax=Electrophorus electricus TaxID=8005 RepID=UPI0015D05D37|nr:xenotropic and polytropic retrovirus receptor 1 homolog [Electrophorus electricus]